jgi:hypothetical protein
VAVAIMEGIFTDDFMKDAGIYAIKQKHEKLRHLVKVYLSLL